MVMQAPLADVFEALLEHLERFGVFKNLQRFQKCLHQINVHHREYLLVVPSDPDQTFLAQKFIQPGELFSSLRDVEGCLCGHGPSPLEYVKLCLR